MRHFYLTGRFFTLFGIVALSFVTSYLNAALFPLSIIFFSMAVLATLADAFLLFNKKNKLQAERKLPKILSLGDSDRVALTIVNRSAIPLRLSVVEELPVQFQKRDFEEKLTLAPGEETVLTYEDRPITRGAYEFGYANLFAKTRFGLVERHFRAANPTSLPVFPSVIQMKQYELLAFNRVNAQEGLRKIRRVGHSYEFEQIKEYVLGDDYRSLNWKATGRAGKLMINQYEDERSQQVYCIIDKSRAMKMPFHGLSLLDYAINASLAISNIILKKYDKAGLITFSDKIGATIKSDRRSNQLNKILQALYREQERPSESNFELLYHIARKLVIGRSLLLLFTNFESKYALERALPYLRRINGFHLLVVIFFENVEIENFARQDAKTMEDIYTQTVARNFLAEKTGMVQTLRQHGIQSILTRPEDLSARTINKYLELKSRGMI